MGRVVAAEVEVTQAMASCPVRDTVRRATEDTPRAPPTVAQGHTAREDTVAMDNSQEGMEVLPLLTKAEGGITKGSPIALEVTAAAGSLPATTSSLLSLGTASSHLHHPLPDMTVVTHHHQATASLLVVVEGMAVVEARQEDMGAVDPTRPHHMEEGTTASLHPTAAHLHRATARRASTGRAQEEDMEMRAPL